MSERVCVGVSVGMEGAEVRHVCVCSCRLGCLGLGGLSSAREQRADQLQVHAELIPCMHAVHRSAPCMHALTLVVVGAHAIPCMHADLLHARTHTRGGWCTCAPCRGRGSARSQWPAAGGQGAKGEGGGGGGTVASCMQERASESEGGRHYRACMQGSGGGQGGALVRHSVANTATATQCVLVHTCSSLPTPHTRVHTCSRRSKSCNSSFDCDKVKITIGGGVGNRRAGVSGETATCTAISSHASIMQASV